MFDESIIHKLILTAKKWNISEKGHIQEMNEMTIMKLLYSLS